MAEAFNGNVSCLVSGSQLFKHELASPLIILLVAVIVALVPVTFMLASKIPAIRRLRRYRSKLLIPIVVITLIIPVASIYYSIRPSLSYGAWLNGSVLYIRFYQDDTVSINICHSNFSLASTEEALSMLSLRTNGLSDPLSGVHMGYYRTKDGHNAYVLILSESSKEALIVWYEGKYVIIALPCVKKLYYELMSLEARLCRS